MATYRNYQEVKKYADPEESKRKNKNGYKGVIKSSTGRYASTICIRKNSKDRFSFSLGTFDTPEQAYIERINYLKAMM